MLDTEITVVELNSRPAQLQWVAIPDHVDGYGDGDDGGANDVDAGNAMMRRTTNDR